MKQLTPRQVAAATLLILAGGGGGGAGGTAGGGAGGGAGGAGGTAGSGKAVGGAGAGKPVGAPVKVSGGGGKKVSSMAGAAYYHLPIGALIVAHGKTTMTTGATGPGSAHGIAPGSAKTAAEPETMPKGWIPEPKWLEGQAEWEAIWKANEWKGSGSKHIWASGHMFSVPNDADVFVPQGTDTAKDHDVAEAEKIVVIGKPGAGKAAKLLASGKFEEITLNDHLMDGLAKHGTKMAEAGTPHLPTQPDGPGGATHWVPEGWHVYKHPSVANYLYAKSPDGQWHTISKSGIVDFGTNAMSKAMDAKLQAGILVPYEHPGIHAEHQPPPGEPQAAGPIEGKTTIAGMDGPLEVTYDEVSYAITLLNGDKSTQVKLPLKNAGQKLAWMDYHAISKEELKNYPELKLAPGSKQKHVGQVKINVLHYLARVLDEQPKNDAQQAQADAVPDKIADQVSHSYEIAPATFKLGAAEQPVADLPYPDPEVEIEQEEKEEQEAKAPDLQSLVDKVKALPKEEVKAPGPKQVGGVEVTAADIQDAISALEAHPTSTAIKQILKGAGNKLAAADYWAVIHAYEKETGIVSKGKAREQFITALKGYLEKAQIADDASGTDAANQLQALLSANEDKAVLSEMVQTPVTFGEALTKALLAAHTDGTTRYVNKSGVLTGKWTTGTHKWDGEGTVYTVTQESHVSFKTATGSTGEWTAANVLALAMKHLGDEPHGPEAPSPSPEAAPESGNFKKGDYVTDATTGSTGQVYKTDAVTGPKQYVTYVSDSGTYHSSYAENLKVGAHEDEQIQAGKDEAQVLLEKAKREAKKKESSSSLSPKVRPKPEPAEPPDSETLQITATEYGKSASYDIPAGSKVYSLYNKAEGTKWVEYPDGTWHYFDALKHDETVNYQSHVDQGVLKPVTGLGKPEPPAEESIHEQISTEVMKLTNSMEVFGLGKPLSYKLAAALIQSADEGNHYFSAQQLADHGMNGPYAGKDMWVIPSQGGGWEIATVKPPEDTQFYYQVYSNGKVWTGGFQAPDTPASPEDVLQTLQGGSALENSVPVQAGPPVSVTWKGEEIGQVPAGSVVYTGKMAGLGNIEADSATKYIKKPDGGWLAVSPATGTQMSDLGISPSLTHEVETGDLVPWSDKAAQAKEMKVNGPAKDTPKDQGVPPDEQAGIKLIVSGKVVKEEAPAGSTLYLYNESTSKIFIKLPDGNWAKADKYQVAKQGTYNKDLYDGYIKSGKLKKVNPPTQEELAQAEEVAKFQAKLQDGVADPAHAGDSWQNSAAAYLTGAGQTYGSYNVGYLVKNGGGDWEVQNYPGGYDTYTKIDKLTLTGTKVTPDGETPVPFSDIKQALDQHLVSDAVVVEIDGKKKVFKYGNYYKPKGKGTYLEIKTGGGDQWGYHEPYKYGDAAKATFIWHKQDGDQGAVTPTYAAKQLETATDYLAPGETKTYEPKGSKTPAGAQFATAFTGSGDFKFATAEGYDTGSVAIYADGSVKLNGTLQIHSEESATKLLSSGAVLDSWENSVIKPGLEPSHVYVFGNKLTVPEAKDFIHEMEKAYDDKPLTQQLVSAWLPNKTAASGWTTAHKVTPTWQGQRDAILGLLREMMAISTGELAGSNFEPQFLKGLPPGISVAKDIFHFNAMSQAKPGDVALPPPDANLALMSSPDLLGYIKAVSLEFGGGKVIGTHVSSMSKDARVAWIKAWQAGDMKTIFGLDAASGKVSLAHPGAPDNLDTHTIVWAPWGEGETPAGQPVEGEWSDHTHLTLPKAEVDNYIIKAGLKHSEMMSAGTKRSWVVYHRTGNQAEVDKLSKAATQAFQAGYPNQSETPHWTENIKPAKSYDAYLEDKNAANVWSSFAVSDFYSEHYADLLQPFDEDNFGQDTGYQSRKIIIIQRYLDDLQAKENAELSKPVYKVSTNAPIPQATHEVFWITSTVPLTGATQEWLFKPVPAGKEFIAEQAHYAAELGKAWGYNLPSSRLLTFDGEFGQAQVKLAAEGDLEYGESLGFYDHAPIPWQDLTQTQISDIAREHVFDWAIDNNDSRAANFLRLPDGHIVGIDKDRAWRDFGSWDGMSGNGSADQQSALVSTALYNAIRDHSISKEVASQTYTDVIQRARKMERMDDARLRGFMEQAFEHRTKFTGQSAEQVIAKAIDRKNSLSKDFTALYQKVFDEAGYGALPEVPDQKLPEAHDGTTLHSGFSEPDFVDHVHASSSHGTPAFFGGSELEHNHVLVWKEYAGHGTGTPVIKGQTAARGKALEKLTQWAADHQSSTPTNTKPSPPGKTFVKGASGWYSALVQAAKTISTHQADQQFNQSKIEGLVQAENQMSAQLMLAESVLNSGSTEKLQNFTADAGFGTPEANIAAIKHYQQLAEKVWKGKEEHYKFKAGELPDWKPPADLPEPPKTAEPPKPVVELTAVLKPAKRPANLNGQALGEDGELHTGGGNFTYPGQAWHVALPDGEEVVIFGDYADKAHQGWIQFTAKAEDGAASLERIRSFLQTAGLKMDEAEESDLELYYWRHLGHVLADRKDSDTGSKHGKVWDTLKTKAGAAGVAWTSSSDRDTRWANIEKLSSAGLSPEAELEIWHAAFANITSASQVEKFSQAKGWMPRMRHWDLRNPTKGVGNPYYMRFDADMQDILDHTKALPSSRFNAVGKDSTLSGGLHSRDERIRMLGSDAASGMGNEFSYGSTGYVYTRLNQSANSSGNEIHAILSPSILAHTTTYSFNDDEWGAIDKRQNMAYFDIGKAAQISSGANETMVKEGVSLLDEVEILIATTNSEREAMIQALADLGIYEIRGVPVAERILVEGQNVTSALNTVKAAMKAENYGWNW